MRSVGGRREVCRRYVARHKALGLCRACSTPTTGGRVFCDYHRARTSITRSMKRHGAHAARHMNYLAGLAEQLRELEARRCSK